LFTFIGINGVGVESVSPAVVVRKLKVLPISVRHIGLSGT
jgi:hypothetical protein